MHIPGLRYILTLLVAAAVASAQEITASVAGFVTDPSGLAVVDATVTAIDLDRGTAWPAVTNTSGFYRLPRLPVGRYELRAEKAGFQVAVQSGLLLQLNQSAKVDFPLKIGDTAETILVGSAAPLLQTQSAQLGVVVNSQTNVQLPLATRNYIQLTMLAPGSIHPSPENFTNGQTTGNSARPHINGNREQANNFILDGVDNNQVSDNLVGYAPSPDAIEEFNLIQQNASAEFGNFMGGIVNVSTKAGSNRFHGTIFEFFRNDKLNANRWDYNFLGTSRPLIRWNQFGGALGGPIRQNKLFFFLDYQGERFNTPASTGGFTVLTNEERTGDFSPLLAQGIQIKDPKTGDQFLGNRIPVSMLDPVAARIVNSQYYPAPINGNLVNNQINTVGSHTNGDQGDIRVDWAPSEKDHILSRYSQSRLTTTSTNSQLLSYNSSSNAPAHNGVLDWTHALGASFLNDARIGVNYVVIRSGADGAGLPNLNEVFGIPGVPSSILPGMSFSTNSFISNFGNSNIYQLFANTVIQYEDTAIVTRGSQTMHFGFQGWRQRVNTFYSGNNGLAGTFSYSGQFSGRGESDFMLGLPSNVGTGTSGGTWGQRANIFAAYFQNDWHARRNVVFNLGLRYEVRTPWVEVHDRQTNFGLFSGEIQQAGQNGNSRALYDQYNGIGNWQPRIGVAWTPGDGSIAVRAAFTISSYLEGTGTNLRLTINPPYSSEHNADYSSLSYPATTLSQGYTPITGMGECTGTALLAFAADCFSGVTLRVWDPNVRPASSNQWNFSVQKRLGNSATIQASYVGQRATHLMVAKPYFQKRLLPDGSIAPSPYLAGNSPLQSQIGQISGTASDGNQEYHAFQLVVQRRLASGLAFQANYTWSKCMTNSIGYYGAGGQSAPASPYWQNLYDARSEWGPCYYDVPHTFSGYASYDIPVGRNRRFARGMNGIADAFLGGWRVNIIGMFHGGFPLTINAVDRSGTMARSARANCIAPAVIFGTRNVSAALGGGYQWFSPASYAQPESGFGSCGVGTVRGPGLNSADVVVSKLFTIAEGQYLELRGEFLNASNTPILNAPTRSIGSVLGVVNTSQNPRNVQVAIKYNF